MKKKAYLTREERVSLAKGGGIAVVVILLCAIFFHPSGGGKAAPVSAEVESYTPLIQVYAEEYGISEYEDLIKAVMMQESTGLGLDPMQSSEGGFNIDYPKVPDLNLRLTPHQNALYLPFEEKPQGSYIQWGE